MFSKCRHILRRVIKNKVLTAIAFLSIFSISFCFLSVKITVPLEGNFPVCEEFISKDWKDLLVPGQIRSIRIRADDQLIKQSGLKTILLWTKYFSQEYSDDFYFFQNGQNTFKQYNCEFNNCFITSNKSLLPTVDAVLFHARDLKLNDVPERPNRDQIWILYSMEPPRYMILKWKIIQSLFNWTMTYRSDSDVQVKYGEVVKHNTSCSSWKTMHKKSYQKPNSAIWMVSNCRTESRREAYVKELKKFFNVDVYGKCSRKKRCKPPQSKTCYKLLDNYKYYLSFENSICKDYVTEKFFNVLQYDIVPVVFGGGEYATVAPNNSYIDATQFPSPKELAQRLTEIAKNSSLYDSFFEWKSHYTIHLHPWMCNLCKRLHERNSEVQFVLKQLWYWWVPKSMCKRWNKKEGFKNLLQ